MKSSDLYVGKIVRHKGNLKAIKSWYYNTEHHIVVVFLDESKCADLKDLELDGRKSLLY
jgi:hypothetical protein